MTNDQLFKRNVPGTFELLTKAVVGVAGCGGLGSNAAVALVRAGVGHMILADFDVVEESNLNRQHFFQADIGEVKVEALAKHLRAINPHVELKVHNKKLTSSDVDPVFGQADLLIEAFDRAELKKWLLETWCGQFADRPIVCASGISGVGNLEALKIRQSGNIFLVGDEISDMSEGLNSARVAVVANMQASVAIEQILNKGK